MSATSTALIPTPDPLRVFLDSSVLFAAALSSQGSARDLIQEAFRDRLRLLASQLVWLETRRNLAAKAPRALPFLEEVHASGAVYLVEPSPELVHRATRIVVGKDAPIVAGAVAGRAAFLATYDRKHLMRQAPAIFAAYRITVAPPEQILASC